jgi:hypothetical protein
MLVATFRSHREISPMSWLMRILITLVATVALIAIPVVGLVIYDVYERAKVALFYHAHPMLQAMNEVPNLPLAETEPQMADILLKRLPLGSTRSEALRVFSVEGMKCSPAVGLEARRLLVCGVTSPRGRWHVEVQFDDSDKVSGGRVLTLKA